MLCIRCGVLFRGILVGFFGVFFFFSSFFGIEHPCWALICLLVNLRVLLLSMVNESS